MSARTPIYDPSVADGRFQLEVLFLRWALVGLYALFVGLDVIAVDMVWFAASEGFLVAFHLYYTWHVWRALGPRPLRAETAYATPFLDVVAVSLALIAVGDAFHPIWAVYFFIMVGVAFLYYAVARPFTLWLLLNYAVVGIGLQSRGLDVPAPQMGIGAIMLLAGLFNLISYTGGERRLRGAISQVARTDPLTGLLNRRGLEEALGRELEAEEASLGVFMIDVDRFKRYNDQFGHLSADGVLEQLAVVLTEATRDIDLVARYGGDEFVVMIRQVSAHEAVRLAERLCGQVARLGLCTVSIGVSVSDRSDQSAAELLALADASLLAAKQAGRNCVRALSIDAELAA